MIGAEYTILVLKKRRSGKIQYNINLNRDREGEARLLCLWARCAVGAHHLIVFSIALRAIEEGLIMASTMLAKGIMEKFEFKFRFNP